MNCPESRDLHPYFDNELDAERRAAFAAHLSGCSECSSELEMQKALRANLQEGPFRYKAPAGLADRIQLALLPKAESLRSVRPWLSVAAALLIGVAAGAAGTLLMTPRKLQSPTDCTPDLVAAHVRSLMADHLEDVKSTDRHTVKPWFIGKVDFSPPVQDFKEQGYPLLGGRLDYVDNRPTAALVYGRAKHIINLFIRPAEWESNWRPEAYSRRGYNLVNWRQGGLDFWAVSDLNSEELSEFARLNFDPP